MRLRLEITVYLFRRESIMIQLEVAAAWRKSKIWELEFYFWSLRLFYFIDIADTRYDSDLL